MSTFSIRNPHPAGERLSFSLELTIGLARKVKNELGFDLLRPNDQPAGSPFPLIQILHQDLEAFVNVVYVLVRSQCQAVPLTDEQFGEGLDDFAQVREAFWLEWHDFFKRAGVTEVAAAITKQLAVMKRAGEKLQNLDIERMMPALDKELNAAVDRMLTVPLSQMTHLDEPIPGS